LFFYFLKIWTRKSSMIQFATWCLKATSIEKVLWQNEQENGLWRTRVWCIVTFSSYSSSPDEIEVLKLHLISVNWDQIWNHWNKKSKKAGNLTWSILVNLIFWKKVILVEFWNYLLSSKLFERILLYISDFACNLQWGVGKLWATLKKICLLPSLFLDENNGSQAFIWKILNYKL
jgi:hypothetical protein